MLFIDEIGELHPVQMNKLLKVLEDRKVFLESAYYSEENNKIPHHIHDIFQNGLPADFRMIGATTRTPEEIPPAIRSRCLEVFFRELLPEEIKKIAKKAANKLNLTVDDEGLEIVSKFARNGREAVNVMQIAAGLAISKNRETITNTDIEWIIHSSQLSPRHERNIHDTPKVGLVNGLAVYGPNSGALLEIEVTTIPNGKGNINITGIVEEESIGNSSKSIRRKSMAKGSVENVITVLKSMGLYTKDVDIHVNFPGGVPVDGPSAGIAMATAINSAIHNIEIANTVAMTGEISVHGRVKPVGGVIAKVNAAKQAGVKKVLIPYDNMQALLKEIDGIEIIAVKHINEVFKHALVQQEEPDAVPASASFKQPPTQLI
jgi:ATP-dependent Lon protease